MKNLLFLVCLLVLVSCGSATIKKDQMASVKKVAIVTYSIPKKIEFRDNPKEKNKAGFMEIVKMVAKNVTEADATKAAELSYNEFVKSINSSPKLQFKALTLEELRKNVKFQELVSATMKNDAPAPVQADGWLGKLQSLAGSSSDQGINAATVPGIATFGISDSWNENALVNSEKEKEFLKKAQEILQVDAVMVINDMGYSFSCEACVGGTGSASTGSAFNVSLVNKDTSIMNVRQWFSFSKASTPILAGIVPPNMHEKLFAAHGAKMANEFISETETQLK